MATATTVPDDFGSGGKGLSPNANSPTLVEILKDHEEQINESITADLSDDDPVAVGTAAVEGVATEASRSDHVHADPSRAAAGTALTDTASQTMLVSAGYWRTIAALAQAGELTVSNTGAVAGDLVTITRTSVDAHAYVIKNAAGTTLTTLPASKQGFADLQFSGSAWVLKRVGQLA